MTTRKSENRTTARRVMILVIIACSLAIVVYCRLQIPPRLSLETHDGRVVSLIGVTQGAEPFLDARPMSMRGIYWRSPLKSIPVPSRYLAKLGLETSPWVKPSPLVVPKPDARTFWIETSGSSHQSGNSSSFSIPHEISSGDKVYSKLEIDGVYITIYEPNSGERLSISGGWVALSGRRRNLYWFQISQLGEEGKSIILELQQVNHDGIREAPVRWSITLP